MLTSEYVLLLMAVGGLLTLWAFVGGVFMGMNITYGGICWHGISLLVWTVYLAGFAPSALAFELILSWAPMAGGLFGFAFYAALSLVGGWVGQRLVPLLSADIFGRGPVWRWRLQPGDYPLIWSPATL